MLKSDRINLDGLVRYVRDTSVYEIVCNSYRKKKPSLTFEIT